LDHLADSSVDLGDLSFGGQPARHDRLVTDHNELESSALQAGKRERRSLDQLNIAAARQQRDVADQHPVAIEENRCVHCAQEQRSDRGRLVRECLQPRQRTRGRAVRAPISGLTDREIVSF
jgi:hypothetical protein